jgi:hypothetical protein
LTNDCIGSRTQINPPPNGVDDSSGDTGIIQTLVNRDPG